VLPKLVDHAELSLYWSLHHFFSHPCHHHVIFAAVQGGLMKLQPETLFHLLASSTWATNLRILDRNIKCTGLEDIRRPSISINHTLHNQRAELLQTLWHVAMTLKWLPPSIKTELNAVKVHRISRRDLARHPRAGRSSRKIPHGLFHSSYEFHQRHRSGVHQGAGPARTDDHSSGFSLRTTIFRHGHFWHEREGDQRLTSSNLGSN
jgi:hypothetical protein